jgi:drug/metabolite transporter (DMT)-like permease
MPSTERLAALAVLAASASAMLGGFAIVATRLAVPDSNALSVAFLRFLGASVLMLAFTLPRAPVRISRGDWLPVIALGVLQFGVFSWLFTSALQHIPAARGALVLAEPVTWRVLIGLFGIIGGIAIANWGALMRSFRGGG